MIRLLLSSAALLACTLLPALYLAHPVKAEKLKERAVAGLVELKDKMLGTGIAVKAEEKETPVFED
jgi:hypothetical protein